MCFAPPHYFMLPVNPLEVLRRPVARGNPDIAKSVPAERRRSGRVSVHWPISLFPNQIGEDAVQTITENLSSQGFYCLSRKPFTVGEVLLCTLQIPMNDFGVGASHLECQVRVVRVEKDASADQYGIGCRMEDYRLILGGD
jgi:PilZ domain